LEPKKDTHRELTVGNPFLTPSYFHSHAACDYGDPQTRPRLFIFASKPFVPLPNRPVPSHGAQAGRPHVAVGRVLELFSPTFAGNKRKYPNSDVWRTSERRPGSPGPNAPIQLVEDKLAPTIRAKGPPVFHYNEDCPLKVPEVRALQSFPNDYELVGSMTQQYQQVGNAVPCRLARAVAESVREVLEFVYREEFEDEPEVDEAEVDDAEVDDADVAKAEVAKAEVAKADVAKADVAKADVAEADVEEAGVQEEEDVAEEAGIEEAGIEDVAESGVAESGVAESGVDEELQLDDGEKVEEPEMGKGGEEPQVVETPTEDSVVPMSVDPVATMIQRI
jgi:hypothetical protein